MGELSQIARPLKRTVAIHPIMDAYVRETWSLLVKDTQVDDPSYSAALNFMLLAAILEAGKKKGWTKDTRETTWAFAKDRETLRRLKLEEFLSDYKEHLQRQEFEKT